MSKRATTGKGRPLDLTGDRFGRLTVIRLHEIRRLPYGLTKRVWECICDCGKSAHVQVSHLRTGHTISCGCAQSEASSRGVAIRNFRHGLSRSREYEVWHSMIQRCEDPNNDSYSDYGGRGIKVSGDWHSFPNFWRDMGPRPSKDHSIDRIDNDGNYEAGNCKWSTRSEQRRNRRPLKRHRDIGLSA